MNHALRHSAVFLALALLAGCATTTPPSATPVATGDPSPTPCVPVTGSRICRKDGGASRVDTGAADSLKGNSIVTNPR